MTPGPAGCVSALTPSTGKGAITSIDGSPNPPQARWQISIDGGSEAQAKGNKAIGVGDIVYLREM
ncbi:MAG TPA: hypothetical protein VMI13_05630 [Solirubrobacteraceae bacterium]|nr:hypothetical protein [Solirubrobacteraceae bacterium]